MKLVVNAEQARQRRKQWLHMAGYECREMAKEQGHELGPFHLLWSALTKTYHAHAECRLCEAGVRFALQPNGEVEMTGPALDFAHPYASKE